MLRLIKEKTESQPVELRHQILNLRLLEQIHMVRESLADNVAKSLVARWRGAVHVVGGLGELGMIPELETGASVLLNAEILQTSYIVLISHLVHLSVDQQLLRVPLKGA